jgi:hypothetical protein
VIKIEKEIRSKESRNKEMGDFLLGAIGATIMLLAVTYFLVFQALSSPKPENALILLAYKCIGWPLLTLMTIKIWRDCFYSSTTISWGATGENKETVIKECIKASQKKEDALDLPEKEKCNDDLNPFGSRFITWLKNLKEEEQALAMDFIKARFKELVGIRVAHISSIENLVARELYAELAAILKKSNDEGIIDMGLNKMEGRREVFRSIIFYVVSAIKISRGIKKHEAKEDLTPAEQWDLQRDKIYLQKLLEK